MNSTIINNKFTLAVPSSWKDQTVYRFEGDEEDGIKHNIIVTIENNIVLPTLKSYSNIKISALKNELQGFQELKNEQIKLNNNLPAHKLVYKWSPINNRSIIQKAVFVIFNNTGYILTATFSEKTYKTKGLLINKIMMSFEVSVR